MTREQIQTLLKPGQLAQIGCVVRDVEKTMADYENLLGIGPFHCIEFAPEIGYIRDREAHIRLKIGIAQLTPEMSLELIQVLEGESYHNDFLTEHGEGVQHLGFLTQEYDAVLERARSLGIPVLMSAETDVAGMGHVRGAYLDTHPLVGVLVEIIEVTPPS